MLSLPSPREERAFSRLPYQRHIKTRQPTLPELTLREYNTKPPAPPLALKQLLRAAQVTSSCLCKKAEGAVFPFILLVHSVEDGIDNPIHAADIDEADHGPRAASHFHETPLDDIGGAELAPKVTREVEEGEQLGQILLQALHHPRIGLLPGGP